MTLGRLPEPIPQTYKEHWSNEVERKSARLYKVYRSNNNNIMMII